MPTIAKPTTRRNSIFRKTALLFPAILLAYSSFSLFSNVSYAAYPKLDNIRVALYIETPKYKLTVPSVALSSAGGLAVGRRDTAVRSWFTVDGGQAVRFGADAYTLSLKPTEDFAAAKSAAQQLTTAGFPSKVTKTALSGKSVFQVEAGPYPTADLATAALAELAKNSAFAGLIAAIEQAGPLHLSAGNFATEAEAAAKRAPIGAAGVKSELALLENPAGGVSYAVWVGAEASPDKLAAVKQKAETSVLGLALQPIDPAAPYLLKRDDMTAADAAAAAPTAAYLFNANGQKIWVAPKQGEITVKEKGNRTYRGGIEFSQFNGKMAVINELPFEQYLYSVVNSEMGTGWPLEALKAQAVAARTYALQAGTKYQIANVTDSTSDQAYNGSESPDVTKAVDATKGEVLAVGQSLVTPFYSANAGGLTADANEVWGTSFSHLKSVASADEGAAKGKAAWLQIVTMSGVSGFVPAASMRDTGSKNAIGLAQYEAVKAGVQIRNEPYPDKETTQNTVNGLLNPGERVSFLGQAVENNSYVWRQGPIDAGKLIAAMNGVLGTPIAGPLYTLEVASKGVSGRVTGLKANGQDVKVSSPDAFRTVLNDLRSTLFDIEETGRYTVIGANGTRREFPQAGGVLYAVQGTSGAIASPAQPAVSAAMNQDGLIILNAGNKVRLATKDAKFAFTGKGWGHGIGMSQWGARGYAEQGNDYRWILTHYYTGATIVRNE